MVAEALSYHSPVRQYTEILTVVARFARVAHGRASDGSIITLTALPSDGPLTVRMPSGWSPARLPLRFAFLTGASGDQPLRRSCARIRLKDGKCWEPARDVLNWNPTCVRRREAMLQPLVRGSALFRLDPLGCRLAAARQVALEAGARCPAGLGSFRGAVSGLVGLGPGLTPAGDDWLVGFATCLWHLSHAHPWEIHSQMLAGIIRSSLKPGRTTDLSTTLVYHATDGVASSHLVEAVRALPSPAPILEKPARFILELGHTSGADMLLGVCDAAESVLGWAGRA